MLAFLLFLLSHFIAILIYGCISVSSTFTLMVGTLRDIGVSYLLLIIFHILMYILNLGDKTLDGYQKKKYVCKLLFIFLLGHDIDFGHMEAVNLLSSNKYTEKQIVSVAKM